MGLIAYAQNFCYACHKVKMCFVYRERKQQLTSAASAYLNWCINFFVLIMAAVNGILSVVGLLIL